MEVEIRKPVPCPRCNGFGHIAFQPAQRRTVAYGFESATTELISLPCPLCKTDALFTQIVHSWDEREQAKREARIAYQAADVERADAKAARATVFAARALALPHATRWYLPKWVNEVLTLIGAEPVKKPEPRDEDDEYVPDYYPETT